MHQPFCSFLYTRCMFVLIPVVWVYVHKVVRSRFQFSCIFSSSYAKNVYTTILAYNWRFALKTRFPRLITQMFFILNMLFDNFYSFITSVLVLFILLFVSLGSYFYPIFDYTFERLILCFIIKAKITLESFSMTFP